MPSNRSSAQADKKPERNTTQPSKDLEKDAQSQRLELQLKSLKENQNPVKKAHKAPRVTTSQNPEIVALSPQDIIRLMTQGTQLSKGQELEFNFYIHKAFGNHLTHKSLKDVLDIMEGS